MKNNKKILLINTSITVFVSLIIIISFFINLNKIYIYILYIVLSFLLFITIYFIKRIISNKEIKSYFVKSQKLMFYSTILFLFAFISMMGNLIYLTYPLIIISSIIFTIGFLKITLIGKFFKKRSKKNG